MKKVVIDKNRGWRGLVNVTVLDEDNNVVLSSIMSFSSMTWDDLVQRGIVVIADDVNYYVIDLAGKPTFLEGHQRSVLIKNYTEFIGDIRTYEKAQWNSADASDWVMLMHFLKNKQNHTTSDWNCIGLRVLPEL